MHGVEVELEVICRKGDPIELPPEAEGAVDRRRLERGGTVSAAARASRGSTSDHLAGAAEATKELPRTCNNSKCDGTSN